MGGNFVPEPMAPSYAYVPTDNSYYQTMPSSQYVYVQGPPPPPPQSQPVLMPAPQVYDAPAGGSWMPTYDMQAHGQAHAQHGQFMPAPLTYQPLTMASQPGWMMMTQPQPVIGPPAVADVGRKPMEAIDVQWRPAPASGRQRSSKLSTSRVRKQSVPYARSARGAAQGRLQAMVGEIAANINRTVHHTAA